MNTFAAPPWSPADLAQLRSLTAAGWADKQIGRRLGRTAKAVAQRRRLLGIRKHGRVRRRVRELARAGYPPGRIAALVGRAEKTVRTYQRGA